MIKQQQNERMTSNFRRRRAANEMMRQLRLDEEEAVCVICVNTDWWECSRGYPAIKTWGSSMLLRRISVSVKRCVLISNISWLYTIVGFSAGPMALGTEPVARVLMIVFQRTVKDERGPGLGHLCWVLLHLWSFAGSHFLFFLNL